MPWIVCLYKLGLTLELRLRTLGRSLLGGKFRVRLPGVGLGEAVELGALADLRVVRKPLEGLARRRIAEIPLCQVVRFGALPLRGRGSGLLQRQPRPGLERLLGRADLLLPLQHALVGCRRLGLRALVLGWELGGRQALGLRVGEGVLVLGWSLRGAGMWVGLRVGLISGRAEREGVMRLGVELDRGGAVYLWAGEGR